MAPREVAGLEALVHKPLVLVEAQAGGDAPGPIEPRFVLYEDGDAIYRRGDAMLEATIPPAEARAFADELVRAGFMSLASSYTVVAATDLSETTLAVRDGKRWQLTHARGVYGPERAGMAGVPLPAAVAFACAKVVGFDPPGASAWSPKAAEVDLSDSKSTEPADPWPSDVPAPPKGFPPAGERGAFYTLDGRYLPALQAFLAGPPRRWKVSLEGRTLGMSVSGLRPGEDYMLRMQRCLNRSAWSDGGVPAVCREEPADAGADAGVRRR